MTALAEEIEGAIADGCEIVEMHSPVRIETQDGHVSAMCLQPQIVGPDRGGTSEAGPPAMPGPRESPATKCWLP